MERMFEIEEALYPFESHFFEYKPYGYIHYLDEGPKDAPAIVLFHGNPSYSLLYSEIIQLLRGKFRCIAPDYLGFGFSSKPDYHEYGYTPQEHSDAMIAFLETLDLSEFSVFVQDWGGPIGLNAACEFAEKIKCLFIGNTWAWPFRHNTKMGEASRGFSHKMGGYPMKEKIMEKNTFLTISIPLLIRGMRKRNPDLVPALKQAYLAPFEKPEHRIPTWVFPREITHSYPFLFFLEQKLEVLLEKPTILFWGEQDKVFPTIVREEWEKKLKAYRRVDLPKASHFFQSEEPDLIAEEITKELRG
ncbi:MAG: alpha/beta fold hydrolase [Candidatus Hydrogenedentota bacterium]|nr:MAG: alpha/beta fold hydrolase [Candidatus Hydrogenedentota bacterium]